jgi:hypothetical protein
MGEKTRRHPARAEDAEAWLEGETHALEDQPHGRFIRHQELPRLDLDGKMQVAH